MSSKGKVTKQSVHYRAAKDPAKERCGNCSMFVAATAGIKPATCTLVLGYINPIAICDRWEKK